MRIAIVVPRYGPEIVGGAEMQARGLAESAGRRGWQVEVWTTCARSYLTWANELRPGTERINGVLVRRFRVQVIEAERYTYLDREISRARLRPAEHFDWLECGPHSPALYAYAAAHGAEFDFVLALPYVQAMVHDAAWAAGGRVVVVPCLHHEPLAFIQPLALLLESAHGVLYNSPEEGWLAEGFLGLRPRRSAVLGEGASLPQPPAGPAPGAGAPLLYLGRLEPGKNLSLLYEYARRYVDEGGQLELVVAGTGPLAPPEHPAFRFVGVVSEAEKAALCASALALVQPSLNESFSLTIMESWLAGRPVIVFGGCPVTRGHLKRSRGGLWFSVYPEFVGVIEWLRAHPQAATRMGHNGRAYVQRHFTWEAVLDRLAQILGEWAAVPEAA